MTPERWAASSGICFAIVVLVARLVPSSPPHYNAAPAAIVSYLGAHHGAFVTQMTLHGVALVLFLWFLSSYVAMFRDARQNRLARVVFGGGVALVGIAGGTAAIGMTVTQMYGTLDPSSVAALYGLGAYCGILLFWCLVPFALAAGLATMRSHALPEWYAWLAYCSTLVFLLTGLSFASHGLFSPVGAMPWVGFACFVVWTAVSGWLCLQRHPAHAPSMSPAMSH